MRKTSVHSTVFQRNSPTDLSGCFRACTAAYPLEGKHGSSDRLVDPVSDLLNGDITELSSCRGTAVV